jgi:hypothetical protein
MPWYDTAPKPSRQYAIRTRRCRQRVAQRLGAGLAPEAVAMIERLERGEVETLLEDEGFRGLVGHYRSLAAMSVEERRRRLAEAARQLLELGIAAGDLRVAAFVMYEEDRDRDPAVSLGRTVEREAERLSVAPQPAAPPPGERRRSERPEPEPMAAFAAPSEPRPPGALEADYAACAIAIREVGDAQALAVAELGRVHVRLGAVRAQLRRKILAELEREAILPDEVTAPVAMQGFARAAHARAGRCFAAVEKIDRHRRAFREGEPPPVPESRPAIVEQDGAGCPEPTAGPAPSPGCRIVLPAWLERVDYRVRQTAVLLPPDEREPYLRRIGAFYGFDTG